MDLSKKHLGCPFFFLLDKQSNVSHPRSLITIIENTVTLLSYSGCYTKQMDFCDTQFIRHKTHLFLKAIIINTILTHN